MPPPVKPPLSLFPPVPSLTFAEDDKMKRALATARDGLKAARSNVTPSFRLAIIDLDGGKFGVHEPKPDTMDYTASEAKVIALYAAFALRDMVRRFASSRAFRADLAAAVAGAAAAAAGKPPPKPAKELGLFDALRAEVNPALLDIAHPLLGTTKAHERLPRYEHMFVAPKSGAPDFTGQYKNWLRAMIVPSSNSGAMQCIHGIGYAYLNGAMKEALLFKDNKGPWLAGDFIGTYTYARIDSENDQGVAQAGTALSMAKLMAIIVKGAVPLEGDSFTRMKELLHDAVYGVDTPFLTRAKPYFSDDDLRFPKEVISHIKLGLGPLKAKNGGHNVGSEVWHLEGLYKPSKAYALAYHNLDWKTSSSEDLAFMIRKAISLYEA